MTRLGKIVIGTSFGSESDGVVAAGVALAQAAGAAVELVHALPLPVDVVAGTPMFIDPARWLANAERDVGERLDTQASERGANRARDRRRVERGEPHRVLLARAAATGADLLVLGAAVNGRPHRYALGSTAHRVIRKARCPVLVVRPGCATPPARILAAVDLSPDASGVLRHGLEIAAPADRQPAEVEALFVHTAEGRTWPQFTAEQIRRLAEDELARLVDAALPRGPGARCVVRNGHAGEEILAEAAARKSDLIVVGTHGRGGLERALLGSVAAEVVREAPCNVLVVPSAALAAREEVLEGADWTYIPDAMPSAAAAGFHP